MKPRISVEITGEGLFLMDPQGNFGDMILPATVVLTRKDSEYRKEYDIPTYITTSRKEREFMLIPDVDLKEEGWYTIDVSFGSVTVTLQYLQVQDTTNRVTALAKSIELNAIELKGVHQVTYKDFDSQSNVTVILTATALLNACVIAWSTKQYADSYELFIKLKNTLSLWKTP